MRIAVWLMFAALAVSLTGQAADPAVPAAAELLKQLEGAEPAEQQQTLNLLKQHHGPALDADCQRLLLGLVTERTLDDEVLGNVLKIWASSPDCWDNCRPQIAELQAAARKRDGADEVRKAAMVTLMLISGALPDRPEIPRLFVEILHDRTESRELRKGLFTITAFNMAAPADCITAMMTLMADLTEDREFRLQMFNDCATAVSVFNPEHDEALARLLLQHGLDETEDAELRSASLSCFGTLILKARGDDAEKLVLALSLTSLVLEFVSNRDAAGETSVKQASHRAEIDVANAWFYLLPPEYHARYIQKICYPRGSLYGLSREHSGRLLDLMSDSRTDERVRETAGSALRYSHAADQSHVPALTAMLRNEGSALPPLAAVILGGIGEDARAAVPALIELWEDVDTPKETREAVKNALRQIDPVLAARLGMVEDTTKP